MDTTTGSSTPNTNQNRNQDTAAVSIMVTVCGPYTVHSPPIKKQMISGHLLPTLRSATAISMLQQPKRQISIVVYTSTTTTTTTSSSTISSPNNISQLLDDDRVMVRICRLASDIPTSPKNNDDIVDSPNNKNHDFSTSGTASTTTISNSSTHWVEHKVYRLEEVQVLKQRKDSIEVQLGLGNDTIVRDFKFTTTTPTGTTTTSDGHVAHFCSMILIMKQLEQKRAMKQMEQYKLLLQQQGEKNSSTDSVITSGNTTNAAITPTKVHTTSNKIQLLVEIVSITNLPIADLLSTDGYVVVRLGAHEIHRTSVISSNLSPIFTLFTGSLFTIVYSSIEEFFKTAASGLSFTIKDYDSVGSNDLIGTVQVPIQQLLNGTGQRIPYPIVLANPPTSVEPDDKKSDVLDSSLNNASKKKKKKGGLSDDQTKKVPTLYLRYKQASQHEIDFIQEFMTRCSHGNGSNFKFNLTSKMSSQHSICGIYASETFLSIRLQPLSNNILHRHEKRNKDKEIMVR
jgi:C2 domain